MSCLPQLLFIFLFEAGSLTYPRDYQSARLTDQRMPGSLQSLLLQLQDFQPQRLCPIISSISFTIMNWNSFVRKRCSLTQLCSCEGFVALSFPWVIMYHNQHTFHLLSSADDGPGQSR